MNPDDEIKRKNHNKAVLKYYHKRMEQDAEYAAVLRVKAMEQYYARRAAEEVQGVTRKQRGRPRTVIC
jgi:hypothetical protein